MTISWGQSSSRQIVKAVFKNSDIAFQMHAKIQATKINLHPRGIYGCDICECGMRSRGHGRQSAMSESERKKAYFLWIYRRSLVLSDLVRVLSHWVYRHRAWLSPSNTGG